MILDGLDLCEGDVVFVNFFLSLSLCWAEGGGSKCRLLVGLFGVVFGI